jgi:hypothetical protein
MWRLRSRRPSAALVVALLALFVAAGGPAEAARMITGRQIKDRSLQTRDLSRKAIKALQRTPPASVGQKALQDGAVTTVKVAPAAIGSPQLAPGAVGTRELRAGAAGTAQLADGAVTGAKIADGTLDTRDFARFSGRFRVTVPAVPANSCWSGEPVGLAPEAAQADISSDLVLVTPDAAWPEDKLAFTVRGSANKTRFVLAGCNVTNVATQPIDAGFRYVVLDLP